MIAALLWWAAVTAGPPAPASTRRQSVAVRWDAGTKACVPTVRSVDTGDIQTDAGRTALVAALPDKGAELHLLGGADVPYACMVAIVDALNHSGYYGRVGFIAEPPPPAASRP